MIQRYTYLISLSAIPDDGNAISPGSRRQGRGSPPRKSEGAPLASFSLLAASTVTPSTSLLLLPSTMFALRPVARRSAVLARTYAEAAPAAGGKALKLSLVMPHTVRPPPFLLSLSSLSLTPFHAFFPVHSFSSPYPLWIALQPIRPSSLRARSPRSSSRPPTVRWVSLPVTSRRLRPLSRESSRSSRARLPRAGSGSVSPAVEERAVYARTTGRGRRARGERAREGRRPARWRESERATLRPAGRRATTRRFFGRLLPPLSEARDLAFGMLWRRGPAGEGWKARTSERVGRELERARPLTRAWSGPLALALSSCLPPSSSLRPALFSLKCSPSDERLGHPSPRPQLGQLASGGRPAEGLIRPLLESRGRGKAFSLPPMVIRALGELVAFSFPGLFGTEAARSITQGAVRASGPFLLASSGDSLPRPSSARSVTRVASDPLV